MRRSWNLGIIPRVVTLSRVGQVPFVLEDFLLVATAAILFTRYRNELDRAEEAMHVSGWQLRPLVPREAHARVSLAPPVGTE